MASTAVSTARIRAAESRRTDRLFDDPLAVEVARAAGRRSSPDGMSAHPMKDYLKLQVVVRTVFYDGFIRAAIAAGCRQVVLVAAGYDARAFRLDLPPETTVFELDQPSVLDEKETAIVRLELRPSAVRLAVPVDLRADDWPDALAAAGHDRSLPTAWLLEGLLVYLDNDAAERLLTAITEASPAASRLACERNVPVPTAANGQPDSHAVAAARWWLGGPDSPADLWLTDHGWACTRTSVSDAAAECGRPAPPALRAAADRRGFVTAIRQQ